MVFRDRYFQDLVPTRDGKANLYTHLFRAIYATIATHWFCPTTVSDLEFRAYIQGHFKILDETNLSKQTDMASQRHYWDYKISDGHGNIDGRLGIRLNEDGVEVIQHFAPKEKEPQLAENYGDLVKITVWSRDREVRFSITDNAHSQISQRLNIPLKYYKRMHSLAPDLLATNVNTWFLEKPERRMIRILDGKARAYLSDRKLIY